MIYDAELYTELLEHVAALLTHEEHTARTLPSTDAGREMLQLLGLQRGLLAVAELLLTEEAADDDEARRAALGMLHELSVPVLVGGDA